MKNLNPLSPAYSAAKQVTEYNAMPTFATSGEAYAYLTAPVNAKFGAPMGRPDKGANPDNRVFDRGVPLNSGGYDRGGAYWGHGTELRVAYTRDLSFVRFYRVERYWAIQGHYSSEYGFETVSAETNYLEAKECLRIYRENEPGVRFRMIRTYDKPY